MKANEEDNELVTFVRVCYVIDSKKSKTTFSNLWILPPVDPSSELWSLNLTAADEVFLATLDTIDGGIQITTNCIYL